MHQTLKALAFAAALSPAIAAAQVPQFPQNLPANTVVGRLGTQPGPSQAITFTTLAAQLQLYSQIVSGPPTTTVGHIVYWGSNNGTKLADGGAPAGLTSSNDTNVTVTLGGAPAAALLAASSITMGWSGTLAVARGGSGGGTASGTLLDNITGFSSTGFLTRTGTGTYAFQSATNGITRANLAQVAASSLMGNPTGSTANESAITLDPTLQFSGTTLKCTPGSASQSGCLQPDNVTITIVGGKAVASGGSATTVTVGSTTIGGSPPAGGYLYNNAGTLGSFSPAPISNSLAANVPLNNIANYFDGPSVAQGTTGTWWASGTVVVNDAAGSAVIFCKLWDGTTVIASAATVINGTGNYVPVALSGFLATPAANIRISCRDTASTSGQILFNQTGNSKDGTISAHRIQ